MFNKQNELIRELESKNEEIERLSSQLRGAPAPKKEEPSLFNMFTAKVAQQDGIGGLFSSFQSSLFGNEPEAPAITKR